MINQDDEEGLNQVRTDLEKLGGFRDFLHHTDENGITNFEKIYAQVGLEFPRDKATFISNLATMSNVGELGLEVGRLQHIYDCRTKGREICSRVRENPDYAHLAQLIANDDENNKDLKTFSEIGSKLNERADPLLKHTNINDKPLYLLATNYTLLKSALKTLAAKPTAENLHEAGKKLEDFTSFCNSFAAAFPEFAEAYKDIVGPFNEQMKNNCYSYAEIHFPDLKPVTLENVPGHKHGKADAEIGINIENQDNEEEQHEYDILEPGPEENLIQVNEAENQDQHPEVQAADLTNVDNYYIRYAHRFEDVDPEKRLSYLARTIAACIMREQLRSGTIRQFNRKDADRNAAELMKKPAIRQIAKDQNQFNGLMFKSKWKVAEEGGKLINPFSGVKRKDELYTMESLPDSSGRLSSTLAKSAGIGYNIKTCGLR